MAHHSTLPAWYVCDRDGGVLRSETTRDTAKEWAMNYSKTTSVASCHEIASNDYLYVLVDPASPSSLVKVRILRSDRATAIGIGADPAR
jgi:hypothetical protein